MPCNRPTGPRRKPTTIRLLTHHPPEHDSARIRPPISSKATRDTIDSQLCSSSHTMVNQLFARFFRICASNPIRFTWQWPRTRPSDLAITTCVATLRIPGATHGQLFMSIGQLKNKEITCCCLIQGPALQHNVRISTVRRFGDADQDHIFRLAAMTFRLGQICGIASFLGTSTSPGPISQSQPPVTQMNSAEFRDLRNFGHNCAILMLDVCTAAVYSDRMDCAYLQKLCEIA